MPAFSAAAAPSTVALAQDDMGNDWRRAQVAEVRDYLADHSGIELKVTNARGDASLQALHIERLARRGADVLITSPANGALLDPVIRRVYQNGTPVILLDRRIPGKTSPPSSMRTTARSPNGWRASCSIASEEKVGFSC
ncbi:MAG: substrate-binding domain-containing protein [Thiohalorhabdaceae bacterium]